MYREKAYWSELMKPRVRTVNVETIKDHLINATALLVGGLLIGLSNL